jgi:hypothetical protein
MEVHPCRGRRQTMRLGVSSIVGVGGRCPAARRRPRGAGTTAHSHSGAVVASSSGFDSIPVESPRVSRSMCHPVFGLTAGSELGWLSARLPGGIRLTSMSAQPLPQVFKELDDTLASPRPPASSNNCQTTKRVYLEREAQKPAWPGRTRLCMCQRFEWDRLVHMGLTAADLTAVIKLSRFLRPPYLRLTEYIYPCEEDFPGVVHGWLD